MEPLQHAVLGLPIGVITEVASVLVRRVKAE